MNDIQAFINGMSQQWQKERAATQMTLGGLIKILETMPEDMEIIGLGELDSYRGYYSDLSFEPTDTKRTVIEVLSDCRSAMGEVFTGYKGGDYVMGSLTPLWVAHYGSCGRKFMCVNEDGTISTADDDTV